MEVCYIYKEYLHHTDIEIKASRLGTTISSCVKGYMYRGEKKFGSISEEIGIDKLS